MALAEGDQSEEVGVMVAPVGICYLALFHYNCTLLHMNSIVAVLLVLVPFQQSQQLLESEIHVFEFRS